MSDLLARLARTLTHHWKRGLLAAVVVLVLLGAAAGAGGEAADDFEIPGTESQQALDLFRAHSPAFAGADSTLVFTVDDGTINDPEAKASIEGALDEVKALPDVASVADPYGPDATVSENERLAQVDVRYTKEPQDLDKADGQALIDAAETAEQGGQVQVEERGMLIDLASEQTFPLGELVGIAIAFILLTVLFRSVAAMAVTLVGALIGVMAGQILLTALAAPLDLPSFASVIAMMLGLGAGIDYSLLIIARFREQAAAGDSTRDASAKSAATSGASVVAAGVIVMVAIAGLLVIGVPFIGKLGLAAAIAVGAVVVSAITILPIMIGAFGRWLKPKKAEHVRPSRGFERWGERVTARPWASIAAGVILLLIFAFPVLDMRLGLPDDGNQPTSRTQRVAYDELSAAFGAGSNGPFLIAVDIPKGGSGNEAELQGLQDTVGGHPRHGVGRPRAGERGRRDGHHLRDPHHRAAGRQDERPAGAAPRRRDPRRARRHPAEGYVGGNTAGFEDFSDKVSARLPLFIGVVIGLSVLLLIAAFRSLWIPLASAVFNLLSIVAAYGVVVAVFQDGVGASLIGADSGVPVVSFLPVMMFAILFGLSMDYNVFLLSRMHEAYNEGDAPRASVIHGMARIGKVVLFAGLIMSSVFLAFTTQPDIIGKMFGIGLGLAILIDVLIVRMLIAPAVVTLLGDRAWWLPGWLDRLLPNVSLEGHLVENVDERSPAVPEREKATV